MERDMKMAEMVRMCLLADVLLAVLLPAQLISQPRMTIPVTDRQSTATQDHQHDFDFEFGSWQAHLRRLVHPLSGSHEWVEYDGTSVVHKMWNGAANVGEFDVEGKAGHIEGMTLRFYSPETHKWSIYWANRKDGDLAVPPMVGDFENGRGEFYDHERFNGKPIMVRFIFSNLGPTSFRLEQSFSADGGKSWEPNWISTFTRVQGL